MYRPVVGRLRQIDRVNFSRAFSWPRRAYYSMKFRANNPKRALRSSTPDARSRGAPPSPASCIAPTRGFCRRETLMRKSSITRADNGLDYYYFKTRRYRFHASARDSRELTRASATRRPRAVHLMMNYYSIAITLSRAETLDDDFKGICYYSVLWCLAAGAVHCYNNYCYIIVGNSCALFLFFSLFPFPLISTK